MPDCIPVEKPPSHLLHSVLMSPSPLGAQVLPALIAAARSGNTSRLKQLLERGSAPNQVAVSYLPHVDSGLSEHSNAKQVVKPTESSL